MDVCSCAPRAASQVDASDMSLAETRTRRSTTGTPLTSIMKQRRVGSARNATSKHPQPLSRPSPPVFDRDVLDPRDDASAPITPKAKRSLRLDCSNDCDTVVNMPRSTFNDCKSWTPQDDARLGQLVGAHIARQTDLSQEQWDDIGAAVGRKPTACRRRWVSYIDSNNNNSNLSDYEHVLIMGMFLRLGPQWTIIATLLNNRRTQTVVRNHFNRKCARILAHYTHVYLQNEQTDENWQEMCSAFCTAHSNRLVEQALGQRNVVAQVPAWDSLVLPIAQLAAKVEQKRALDSVCSEDSTSIEIDDNDLETIALQLHSTSDSHSMLNSEDLMTLVEELDATTDDMFVEAIDSSLQPQAVSSASNNSAIAPIGVMATDVLSQSVSWVDNIQNVSTSHAARLQSIAEGPIDLKCHERLEDIADTSVRFHPSLSRHPHPLQSKCVTIALDNIGTMAYTCKNTRYECDKTQFDLLSYALQRIDAQRF